MQQTIMGNRGQMKNATSQLKSCCITKEAASDDGSACDPVGHGVIISGAAQDVLLLCTVVAEEQDAFATICHIRVSISSI
jgi:hypothetical protein